MKMLKTIFAAALSFAAVSVSAQTADEVIGKYVTAMGGAAKLNSINSVVMEGSISVQGMDIPVTVTSVNKKGSRTDIEAMGQSGYQIINPTKSWKFYPFQGDTEPVQSSEAEHNLSKDQLDMTDKLLHAKDLNIKVEYLGKESIDGAPAHKLKLTKPSGEESFSYIDEKTSYIVRKSMTKEINGTKMEIITTYKDFKQTPEGFWYPYTIDSNIQGTVTFSKIAINTPVDEKIFSL